MISHLKETPGVDKVLAMAWLRLACARTGQGDIRAAAEALHECSALLEPLAEDEVDNDVAFLYPELQFYSILLSLYVAKSAKDIRDLENALLEVRSPQAPSVHALPDVHDAALWYWPSPRHCYMPVLSQQSGLAAALLDV